MISLKELILQIDTLKGKTLIYPSGNGMCQIVSVTKPEGPISIRRKTPHDSTPWNKKEIISISTNMLWRYVNALNSELPVHVDKTLGASYNSRSALEAIIAHLPNFFMCMPKRITQIGSRNIVFNRSHKYIIYKPNLSHNLGETSSLDIDLYVTEIPSSDSFFDAVDTLNNYNKNQDARANLDPEIRRLHSQMQVLLSQTANWLKMRSWIAIEDHGINTAGKNILEYPYMIKDLHTENVLNNFPDAMNVAKHIDCAWFNGGMPFMFEVEHTTGVTSGLDRMLKFKNAAPHINTEFVIVAPDDDRHLVMERSEPKQYEDMKLWYMRYSSLIELKHFADTHRYLMGDKRENFVKMFMEQIR